MAKSKSPVTLPSKETMMLGFSLTTPALVAFIAYAILALVIILPFEFPVTDERTGEVYIVKYNLMERFIALVLLAIPTALSVYTINCMMVGKCVLWSYVVSLVSVFWVVLFIISAIIYTFRK
jgi:hypothetical protein